MNDESGESAEKDDMIGPGRDQSETDWDGLTDRNMDSGITRARL